MEICELSSSNGRRLLCLACSSSSAVTYVIFHFVCCLPYRCDRVVTKVLNATTAKERRNSWKRQKSPVVSPRGSFSNSATPRHVAIGMAGSQEQERASSARLELGVRRRSFSRIVGTSPAAAASVSVDEALQPLSCSNASSPDSSACGTPDSSYAASETPLLKIAHSPRNKSLCGSSKSESRVGEGISPSPGVGTKHGGGRSHELRSNGNGAVTQPSNRVRLLS